MDEPEIQVVKVQMYDTGLGREAGYANDQELIEAAKAQQEKMRELLTPEAFKRLEEDERDFERKYLFGD